MNTSKKATSEGETNNNNTINLNEQDVVNHSNCVFAAMETRIMTH